MARPVSLRTLAYVRARARIAMTGRVRVVRWTEPVMGADLRITAIAPTTIYEGVARIASVAAGAALIVGEAIQPTSATTVYIPHDAPIPRVDDVVLVLEFTPDGELVSDAFHVRDVAGGGLLRASRQLTCVAYQASRWWE